MVAVMKREKRGAHCPSPSVNLVPIPDDQLARLDALIEHLIELRDILEGDPEMEPEHHTGEAAFPSSPLYGCTCGGESSAPGDPEDAEEDDPPEDADADEWSGVCLGKTQTGRPRWA